MTKLIVFGNSGSGKSTLAKMISDALRVAHLDLDELAWQNTSPPQRQPIELSEQAIKAFTDKHQHWVIEGCYTDLLELAESQAEQAIFLNLPLEQCLNNAKNRAWEPHKYATKAEQDKNLEMLLEWIRQYHHRNDTFSLQSHQGLYHGFSGTKLEITSNQSSVQSVLDLLRIEYK